MEPDMWTHLFQTLDNTSKAIEYQSNKFDIQITLLESLAKFTAAIDSRFENMHTKINEQLREATEIPTVNKSHNQLNQCHTSSFISDKVQEFPAIVSTLVEEIKSMK